MQTPPRTPSPLTLQQVVDCPGAPVKNRNNPDNVPIGNSVRQCLFPKDDDDGYETPDDQPTIPWNAQPGSKKKK